MSQIAPLGALMMTLGVQMDALVVKMKTLA